MVDKEIIAESLRKCAGGLGQDNLLYVADMIGCDLGEHITAFEYDKFLLDCGVTQETIDESRA